MGRTKTKLTTKKIKKNNEKLKTRKICFLIVYYLLGILLLSMPIVLISKSIKRNLFYKNYISYVNQTKVVLFPDLTQKDSSSNLESWKEGLQNYINQYISDLEPLLPYISQIEKKEKNGSWEEVNGLVMETRIVLLKIMKNKNYFTQTIIMEDLLTLVLEMERTIDQKNDLKLMDDYKDFNSKFTFVIPNLIKSDVIKIGNAMDRIYKMALFQNMDEAKKIYKEIKPIFISSYRDYIPK
jgi:hypothetical protein